MIHYHGSPLGGKSAELPAFYSGRHAFVSFARPDDIGAALEVCQSVALDNGAFSTWRRGEAFDETGYHEWVASVYRHPCFDWAVIPDVIEGSEEENDAMISRWPKELRHVGAPVWHYHESLARLRWLVTEFPRVCLGSSGEWPNPGTVSWWRRTNEAMEVACDRFGRPLCKLHGLRMLDPAIFHLLPLASADSTNAVRNSSSVKRFGMYCPPTTAQRANIIADRIETHSSAAVYEFDRQKTLAFI